MSTYPAEWPPGTVMGRNMVPHPKFPAGSTALGPWKDRGGDIDDRPGTYAGARIPVGLYGPRITLDGLTVAEHAGQQVTVTVEARCGSVTNAAHVGITGSGGANNPQAGHNIAVAQWADRSATYGVWETYTLTLPTGPFLSTFGDQVNPTGYDLVFLSDPAGSFNISAVRVDFAGSPVGDANGYLDGDLDLTPDFDAVWDTPPAGDTFAPTTATALTGTTPTDPDPEDPDPEDPDPEDPDPEDPDPEDPDPEDPDPEDPVVQQVRDFLGQYAEGVAAETIAARLLVQRQAVRAYTRDAGFTDGKPNDDLAAVILSATARDVANPGYLANTTDGPFTRQYSRNAGGWTLQELAALNRWRKRAA